MLSFCRTVPRLCIKFSRLFLIVLVRNDLHQLLMTIHLCSVYFPILVCEGYNERNSFKCTYFIPLVNYTYQWLPFSQSPSKRAFKFNVTCAIWLKVNGFILIVLIFLFLILSLGADHKETLRLWNPDVLSKKHYYFFELTKHVSVPVTVVFDGNDLHSEQSKSLSVRMNLFLCQSMKPSDSLSLL